jgi:hypothetical protein
MDNFAEAHDRYLAARRQWQADVWCSNIECENARVPQQIQVEQEYGQAWYVPEECWICNSGWLDEPPKIEDEDVEEA